MKTSNKILIALGIFLLIFVISMIAVFLIKGDEMSTLITCVFAACTGEVSILGWIKTTKEKEKNENEEIDE